MRALPLLLLAGSLSGCSRGHYRNAADREAYPIVAQRVTSPASEIGRIDLQPAPGSRLADPTDPDRPPRPPDDPAALQYMERPNGIRGSKKWDRNGVADRIELASWEECLPKDAEGRVKLDPDKAVEVALLNSREYQTALEDVYLSALALTLNRFEFATRWFFTQSTFYDHAGTSSTPTESNTLTLSQRLGFNRLLPAGGQLLVDFANTFVFEYTGKNQKVMSSNLLINFIQPLLRNGGRAVRLESLTQAERDVLYQVREFARFRKAFWAQVTTGENGYLDLLQQLQNVRNFQANLSAQEENLRLHEELFRGGKVSVVQLDQAFQSYQQARVSIAQAEVGFQTSLDAFKITLGVPPRVPVELDDGLLGQFQLTDPPLDKLRDEIDEFQRARNRELDAVPTLAALRDYYTQLQALAKRGVGMTDGAVADLQRWGRLLERPALPGDEPGRLERDRAAFKELADQVPELRKELPRLVEQLGADLANLREANRKVDWDALLLRVRRALTLVDQLIALQTQARIYRIELPPLEWDEAGGVLFAKENRLDLMNQKAGVTDAWRKTTVAANALRGELNLIASANLAADPASLNPFDFSQQASRYRVGFEFDGPLNRLAERNNYRASLIAYQRSRRAYMALSDTVELQVRRDLRQLGLTRLTFEAARQTLLAAARQVEATRVRILDVRNAAGTSSTLDILDALNRLLNARIDLVSSYINYSQQRVRLLLDLEALQLDQTGRPLHDPISDPAGSGGRGADADRERPPEQLPAPRPVGPTLGPPRPDGRPAAAALAAPVRALRRRAGPRRRAGVRRHEVAAPR